MSARLGRPWGCVKQAHRRYEQAFRSVPMAKRRVTAIPCWPQGQHIETPESEVKKQLEEFGYNEESAVFDQLVHKLRVLVTRQRGRAL